MHRGQLRVQNPAQEHFNTWTEAAGDQATDLLIGRRPALLPDTQLLHISSSYFGNTNKSGINASLSCSDVDIEEYLHQNTLLSKMHIKSRPDRVFSLLRWQPLLVQVTSIITSNEMFHLLFRDSGCCWVSNVEGKTQWTTYAELDLGTRSDTHTVNSCPVTTTVSSLRYMPFFLFDST